MSKLIQHTSLYAIIKNNIQNGSPFKTTTMTDVIHDRTNKGLLLPEEETELISLAKEKGKGLTTEEEIANLQASNLELQLAIADLAELIAPLLGGVV